MSGDGRPDRPTRRHDLWDEAESSETSQTSQTARTAEPPRSRREHRARTKRSRRGWLVPLAIVLVLALCGGGAFAALRGGDDVAGCGGTTITVAATPEIAGPLEEALATVSARDECAEFEVSSTSAAQAAKDISEGNAPDVWIPDSSTWIDAVDSSRSRGQWLEGQSIASSPVVLAAGTELDDEVGPVSSWGTLLNTEGSVRMANPDVDTASRLAFHASRIGQPGRIGLDTGKRLIFMSRFAAPSLDTLFADYRADTRTSEPFPASEQQIAAFNDENPQVAPLRAVMPKKGTLTLDYPWIINPTLSGEALRTADSARTQLGTLEVREALTEAGFRDSSGRGGPRVDGRPAAELTELEPLDRDERLAAVEQWDLMRTDMRMLAVIDASGSMEWDSPTPGMTRWDVTQGSLQKGVDILPAGSQVGGWMFSSDLTRTADHRELAPIRRLDATVGKGTQRDTLRRLVGDGDEYIGGDTALYDTIWAAHQKMVKEYDPDYVNSIVVFTDGENDDPNGGLSLKQLLRKLDDSYDAERPVRVITIGMGEANPTALQRIADETGGTSYIAETPGDIERVFVQALLARGRS